MTERFTIELFSPGYAAAFKELNLEWIERYFVIEPLDESLLSNPQEHFIDRGGQIVFAVQDNLAVGCCGIFKHTETVYEISKMAVRPALQGLGIGRVLLNRAIEVAQSLGAERLEIISSTRLETALALYTSVGFAEVPLKSDAYERGNIALELIL